MESSTVKAVLGTIAFIILIVVVVVIFARGGNDTPTNQPVPQLAEAAVSDAVFSFTEAGPIVAEEDHFRIRTSVSRFNRTVTVFRGYDNVVVAEQSFSNSETAFKEFLSALSRAGYTGERGTSFDSEAGVCPTGRRFVFESDQFGQDFRRWTTNCTEKGSFAGRFSTTRTLFTSQIPEYNTFIRDTRRETGLAL